MKIGGKDRPIKFGVNQTDLFCEIQNVTLKDYYAFLGKFQDSDYRFGEVRDLVWSALKDGARQAGEEFEHTNIEVGDWMDENPVDIITEVMMALIEGLPKPDDKKKVSKEKLKAN